VSAPLKKRLPAFLLLALLGPALFFLLPVVEIDAPASAVMLDREGHLLGARIAGDGQWRFPPTDSVPEKFAIALKVFEDKRFDFHPGVDPIAVVRALRKNIRQGRVVSGASTLTMQVVRISRKNPPRTLSEKLYEMLLALRLESSRSKKDILAMYSHNAPFGGNTVGVEAASWRYFGRAPEELSWAEACTLAVLPNNPALIHMGRNRGRLTDKRNALLDRLGLAGVLPEQDIELSKLEELPLDPRSMPMLSPHLMDHAKSRADGGWRFHTTIDAGLQRRSTEALLRHHVRLSANTVNNLAALVLSVETGEVLAYIGNVPEFEEARHSNHVDIIRSNRSTGSLLKPFLYISMLQEGELLPNQLVPDIPLNVGGFAPQNFDRTYSGVLTAADALAKSRNVPAVWMLRQYGVDRFYGLLRRMGMGTLFRSAEGYGLSLILGGAEGSLWEMTSMYRNLAWAAGASDAAKTPMPAVHWEQGSSVLSEAESFEAGAAYLGLKALLEVNRPGIDASWRRYGSAQNIAWKTGTSYGFRDAWAIGVTPEIAIGVWAGNANGEGRPNLTGYQAAAPLLFELFGLHKASEWFEDPTGDLTEIEVCGDSGMRASADCPNRRTEAIPFKGLRATACTYCQRIHCDEGCLHRVHAGCESIGSIESEARFVLPSSLEWYYEQKHSGYRQLPPWRDDCAASVEQLPPMSCVFPREGAEIYVPIELNGQRGRVVFQATHRNARSRIFWHLDEDYIGETTDFHQLGLAPAPGKHELTLVDEKGAVVVRTFTVMDVHGKKTSAK
jgi:penicillin-binding protein 1C